MLCCICKEKQATVHFTQIVGDKVQKVDLCEDCARDKGVNDPSAFPMADLLLGLGSAQEIDQAAPGGGELRCPKCGFTQADFKKAGRLGCADCYQTFSEGLETLLKTMHKGTKHMGKVPRLMQNRTDVSDKIKQLSKKLEQAVAQEKYEDAARLRDEIKQLRAKASAVV
jgi:protein arginine kinase activator